MGSCVGVPSVRGVCVSPSSHCDGMKQDGRAHLLATVGSRNQRLRCSCIDELSPSLVRCAIDDLLGQAAHMTGIRKVAATPSTSLPTPAGQVTTSTPAWYVLRSEAGPRRQVVQLWG